VLNYRLALADDAGVLGIKVDTQAIHVTRMSRYVTVYKIKPEQVHVGLGELVEDVHCVSARLTTSIDTGA